MRVAVESEIMRAKDLVFSPFYWVANHTMYESDSLEFEASLHKRCFLLHKYIWSANRFIIGLKGGIDDETYCSNWWR